MRRILYVVAIAVLFGGSATWWTHTPSATVLPASTYRQTRVELGGTSLVADIADTDPLRELGLSGRTGLKENEGMLFVFQTDGQHSFWMKDMLFPIDMVWLSADKKVVYIAANAQPGSYPATFNPESPSRYVIELPAGWAARHHVTVGSQAQF